MLHNFVTESEKKLRFVTKSAVKSQDVLLLETTFSSAEIFHCWDSAGCHGYRDPALFRSRSSRWCDLYIPDCSGYIDRICCHCWLGFVRVLT